MTKQKSRNIRRQLKKKIISAKQKSVSDSSDSSSEDDNSNTEISKDRKKNNNSAANSYNDQIKRLKSSDPEFFKFLEDEDKELLEDEEDAADEVEADEDCEENEMANISLDDDEEETGGKFHVPQELEVASDDSDIEEEMEGEETNKKYTGKTKAVTIKMTTQWTKELKSGSIEAVKNACMAFSAAVSHADSNSDNVSMFVVHGGAEFNAIIRMCLSELIPALQVILKLKLEKVDVNPSTGKNWSKVKSPLRGYLVDVLKLSTQLADAEVLNALLKHVVNLVPLYKPFPKECKMLIKRMSTLWSSADETSRVLAYLTISKVARMQQSELLEPIIKQLYLCYVKNSKFTSPNTLPLINFMQRSLVEILALDSAVTYQYAFIYIRQMAIHLRNAITVRKKEHMQAVYNWQFIHSLDLWSLLLSTTYPNDVLQPLIYPLTQTIIGTIRLVPTARYYPLRFHCVKTLIRLAYNTNTHIPTMPFILEVFMLTDFNKRAQNASFKPLNFACMLKLSKAQMQERAFKDGVIDQVYELLMESLHSSSHTVSFPEFCLSAVMQMKQFIKNCKVSNYTKQIKQILEKVKATSEFVTKRRRAANLVLKDFKAVEAWERNSKRDGTPLSKYYATWRKAKDQELQREIAGKDRNSMEVDVPVSRGPISASAEERKEFKELFDAASDDDITDEIRFDSNKKKPKAKKGLKETDSDYSDLNSDELEELEGSYDDDDSDEEVDDTSDEVDLDGLESEEEQEEDIKKQAQKGQKRTRKPKNRSVAKKARKQDDENIDSDDEVYAEDTLEDLDWLD